MHSNAERWNEVIMNLRDRAEIKVFVKAARSYCGHLENTEIEKDAWISNVLSSLSQLYAAAHNLPVVDVPEFNVLPEEDFEIDIQDRKKTYQSTSNILGAASLYWEFYDPSEPSNIDESPITGNLADDLADIYCDIKPGLTAWDTNIDKYIPEIVFNCRETLFSVHWGIHAVDALRVLHRLVFLRGLGMED